MTNVASVNTSELSGAALDLAVAKAMKPEWLGNQAEVYVKGGNGFRGFHPSSDWSQGGPIVEGHFIDVVYDGVSDHWEGSIPDEVNGWTVQYGERPLIAAMRAYVASKLGDVVAVPEELL